MLRFLTPLLPTASQSKGFYKEGKYHPHFTDKEIEKERGGDFLVNNQQASGGSAIRTQVAKVLIQCAVH